MSKTSTSTHRRRRHRKVRKLAAGFWGRRRSFRQAKVGIERGWRYAWFHRALRKRDFRRLWITRLSAAARMNGLTYSALINQLKKAGIELNRKSLSELAIRDPKAFTKVIEAAK